VAFLAPAGLGKGRRYMAKKTTQASPAKSEAEVTNEVTEQRASGAPISAPIGLPKFNPLRRSAPASEAEGGEASFGGGAYKPSYQDIQDGATGAGVDEWKRADKARAALSETYRSLAEDERYAPEFKAERAWAAYEQTKAKVDKLAPEARQKMLKSASTLERLSIPTPDGESLTTQSTDKLLLTAHERSRIESLIERRTKATAGPFKPDTTEVLRAEYERGLDQGGPGGGATCRAVMDLVRDWGHDVDSIVDAHRRPSHRNALKDAEAARMRADLIGSRVPEPPTSLTKQGKQARSATETRSHNILGMPKGDNKPLFAKQRRRPWK
jgi:hypothetical protein